MIDKERQEIQLSKFVSKVNEEWKKAIDCMKSAEEFKEYIANMCVKCLKPYEEDCDICNGHTTVNELQLTLDFKWYDEEKG